MIKKIAHGLYKKHLKIINEDILKFKLNSISNENLIIYGNLPYNIATEILIKWIAEPEKFLSCEKLILMFQKEVAQRICAQPGSNHYGRLAVLAQAVCRTRIAFTLPPGAFKPPPKVASAVAVLIPLDQQDRFEDLKSLQTVTAAAFGQRRKMLRASLKSIMPNGVTAEDMLNAIGIDPQRRAETLKQQEFRDLTTAWGQL